MASKALLSLLLGVACLSSALASRRCSSLQSCPAQRCSGRGLKEDASATCESPVMVSAAQGLSTSNDKIIDASGRVVTFKGLNWFGFNNGQTMVDGMNNPSDKIQYDFATIVYRLQLMGFNAIRLPFSFADLAKAPFTKHSNMCNNPSLADIAAATLDPKYKSSASANSAPAPGKWPASAANTCNQYVPETSTLDRFAYVVQFFANAGFYVMIDDHTEDATPATASTAAWAAQWASLVKRLSQDPVTATRLIVDVLNEPDARGWGWDKMTGMYLAVMDAVYAVNPAVLFMVEGCGQGIMGANWGDGFCTDLSKVGNAAPGSRADPNPFFRALFTKPYLNKVVISPHIYGPTVTYQSTGWSGNELWSRLSDSFGYLTTAGYTYQGMTKRFPIAIGEFGSKFLDPKDTQGYLPSLASYMTNTGAANDGKHTPIQSFFYWSWNANSGDTGGIVDDSWVTIHWEKIQYLQGLGLKPWYTGNQPAPQPLPSPAPGPSPRPSPTPSPRPSPTPSPCPSPLPSPQPRPTPGPSPKPAPSPQPGSCAALVPKDKKYACDNCYASKCSADIAGVCLKCVPLAVASHSEWACASVCTNPSIKSVATAKACSDCVTKSGNGGTCQPCLKASSDAQMRSCFACAAANPASAWACGGCLNKANPDQCLACVASGTKPAWQC